MHNGDDTANYLALGYRVIAIEADPMQAEKGTERFKEYIANGKLSILNVGVADKSGEFDFYINEKNPEWNSFDLAIASRDGLPWHAIKIKAKSFDQVIKENGVPYYLKVDIEGHDYLCIRGLDPNDLPKFISVEGNEVGLIDQLSEKGFSKFKIISQYNFAHLDLSPNKYFNRWLMAYKMRQWNSLPAKVFRKLGGSVFIRWLDGRAIPQNAKGFLPGTSGNFGDELGGTWQDAEVSKRIYRYNEQLFQSLPNMKHYAFWVDIHATW